MLRTSCAVLASVLFLQQAPGDIDAVTFANAFRAGSADRYKHKQISGRGVSFHGAIQERIADGSTRRSLVVTLGAQSTGEPLTLLKTWDDFVAAERARRTLVVALSGPDLPEPPSTGPVAVEFSGVYDGQVRTIMRAPQAAGGDAPDTGPCPGEQPLNTKESFYCAPLLTGAVATIK